eukprot:g4953.t1
MAMKATLTSLDDLPAELKDHYKQDGDVFVLSVEGIKEHPDVLNLKNAHETQKEQTRAAKAERDALQQRIAGLPDDFDARAYEDLKTIAEGKGGTPTDEQINAIREQVRERLETSHGERVSELEGIIEKQGGAINRMTVDEGLSRAMDAANIDPTHKPKLVPFLKTQGKISVEEADGVYKASVDNGMGPVDLNRFVADWAGSDDGKPYIAKSTGPSPKGGAGGGSKTMSRSDYDALPHTEQRAVVQDGTKVVMTMANTLTDLIPDLYEALDQVSRESTGYISAVARDSNVERAALNQEVRVPVTRAETAATNTPGVTAPDTGDNTTDNVAVTISKSKHVAVRYNGEETKGLVNAGTFSSIRADRMYQGMRTLVNEIEADVHAEVYQAASRASGTAGTTPFATAADMSDFAGVLRILEENGAPKTDLQLVLGHAAIGNLRGKQSGLFKVNEAGSSDMLRNGMTDRVMGFALRHSDAVGVHTKGTGSGYLVNDASSAIGDTTIAADTGSGTVLAGDIATLAGDANKYVVNTALSGGSFAIGKPGLLAAAADNAAITVGNSHTPNVAFARSAIVLATRAPAMPEGGDAADDITTVVDDKTGLAFEVALYKQFLQNVIHIRLAWGQKAIKSEHIGLLLG